MVLMEDHQGPGYRRKIVIAPREGAVLAMLEDDIHCLGVILRHTGGVVTAIEPHHQRLPWDTCPGARDKLIETFSGLPLQEITPRHDKKQNCTHFHDLAVLAAANAAVPGEVVYAIAVSDPVDGERQLTIVRSGTLMHDWREQGGKFAEPETIAGQTLFGLRDWIASLDGLDQESARLLQWAAIVAFARTMPFEQQSTATAISPNCYTFQPERAVNAVRIGERRDFSDGLREPLAGFAETMLAAL